MFSDVFSGYKGRPFAWNGPKELQTFQTYISSIINFIGLNYLYTKTIISAATSFTGVLSSVDKRSSLSAIESLFR